MKGTNEKYAKLV